ncbi:predicted protein [Naegleria gruberi]|uniref:Predicted protein n=1 Tax=Naegleria gruberi TaxID=5762 RepID=D2V7A5_NAEGR|nr:uncharacterized protein NAEGRDRAFT_64725 [Naegleria gruberi]EFC47341.1 predicted protein [Naegleria gruberi]|eukprot:XP_002680085.1 predicted protein [Naegleria gruberi strain NEG-M]
MDDLLSNLSPEVYHALMTEMRNEMGDHGLHNYTEQATAFQPPTTNQVSKERFTRAAILKHHSTALIKYRPSEGDVCAWKDRGQVWKGQVVKDLEIVKGMELIQIEQLKLSPNNSPNHPNRGKYLFARICQPVFRMTSVMTIVENGLTDLNTNIVQLAIYNYGKVNISEEFRVGRYVIIKNPYYKIYSDEWPGLRIDNPNELFFVDDQKIISQLKESHKQKVEELTEPPKWKIIVTDYVMTERVLHSGFIYNDSSIFYWGGISHTEKDLISRQMSETFGELIMLDTYSNILITPVVSGEIPEAGRRNGHVFISDFEEKYAYLIGGGDDGVNDGSFRLCLKTFEWKKLKFKFNLVLSCAASVPGFIYIYGGRQYSGELCKNVGTFFRYDIKNEKLQKLNISKPCPSDKSKSCMTSICNGKYLILYGGDGSRLDSLNDMWLFDCSSLEWIEISNISKTKPPPMTHCGWSKVKINGKDRALVFYGGTGMNGVASNEIWSLDLNTFNWEKVLTTSKNMEALTGYCNHVSKMRLYVYGGMDRLKKLSNKIYCFDLRYHFRNLKDNLELYDWQCVECQKYTTQKTKCGKFSCCSGKCEENYSKKHPEPVKDIPQQKIPEQSMKEIKESSSESLREVELREQVELLQFALKRKTNTMHQLIDQVSEMDNLKKTLSDREFQVQNLEISVKDLTLELNRSKFNLENISKELITSNLKYEKRMEILHQEKSRLENENRQFERKVKEIDSKKSQQVEKKVQQLETKLNEMTQSNKQLDLEKENLKKKTVEQSNIIQNLRLSNTNLEQQVLKLNRECTQLETQTHQFLCDLEEKEKENQDLIGKLAKYYEDLESQEPKVNNHEHLHQQELFECIICMDNKVDHVSVPCGHLFCLDCISNQVNCPTCRGKIESKVKIFLN